MKIEIPEIAEIVRHWMPDANEEELKEATANFRAYLAVIYRIFLRLDSEGRLDEIKSICDCCDEVECVCIKPKQLSDQVDHQVDLDRELV